MAQSLAEKLAALRAAKNPPQESATETSSDISLPAKDSEAVEESSLPLSERIKLLKAKVPASTEIVKPAEEKNSLKDMASALRKMPELKPDQHEKAPAEVHSLRTRIWQLQESSDGSNLKNCMQELQVALLENPTAVSFFLPEDYQEMVRYIRKLTGNAVAQALAKPASKAKAGAKKPDLIQVSLDDLSF